MDLIGSTGTRADICDYVDCVDLRDKRDWEHFLDFNIFLIRVILQLYSTVSLSKLMGAMVESCSMNEIQV